MFKKIKIKNRGVSPIIATVIITALVISVSISLAYWVNGIIPTFTKREEIKILNCYIEDETTAKIFTKNTGNTIATISHVLVNGRLPKLTFIESPLKPGESNEITVTATDYTEIVAFKNGIIYDFTIHTSYGGSYPNSACASY